MTDKNDPILGPSNCTKELCTLIQFLINGQTLLLDGMSFVSRPNHINGYLKSDFKSDFITAVNDLPIRLKELPMTPVANRASPPRFSNPSWATRATKRAELFLYNMLCKVYTAYSEIPNSAIYLPESEIMFIFLCFFIKNTIGPELYKA